MERKERIDLKALPDDPMSTEVDREYILRTYELARSAVVNGNHPFGALLVYKGKIIIEFEHSAVTTRDLTKHAETGLVSVATQQFSRQILSESTLYTSTECCIMCCGAVHWAGIPKMVYGTTANQMSKLLDSDAASLPAREVFQQIHPQMVVVGPVMEEEGLKVHSDSK
ncbi:MAG: nucleoside deaminase [Acidobacteria bacterium]|nr:nucleoside deaminase [Acidobacteriota bacterium]